MMTNHHTDAVIFGLVTSIMFLDKMWHEARRQEKVIRSVMVDHQRRQERRKDFFDSVVRVFTNYSLKMV